MQILEKIWKKKKKEHRDIKLVTTNRRKNYSVSKSNYDTTKCFSENLLAIEIKQIKVKMSKFT